MNTWKKRYLTILAGQGISLLTSGILQMAIIFYLTAKTVTGAVAEEGMLWSYPLLPSSGLSRRPFLAHLPVHLLTVTVEKK